MSDGNTAANISPVNHEPEDMSVVRQVFDRAANAIVEASTLGQAVRELQHTVDGMKYDIQSYRHRIEEQDKELTYVRQARDEATRSLHAAKVELDTLQHDRDNLADQAERHRTEVETLQSTLADTRKQRDDYGFKHMEAVDKLEKAEGTISKFRELLGVMSQPVEAAKPENFPTPSQPEPATPQVHAEPPSQPYEPYHPFSSQVEPAKEPEPKEDNSDNADWWKRQTGGY